MSRIRLAAIVLIGLGAAMGQTATAGDASKMKTEVIMLKHANPLQMMTKLGLAREFKSSPSEKSGNTAWLYWQGAGAGTPGVKVEPNPKENTLTVTGEQTAIDALKKRVEALDVEPRHIRVKAEVYSLGTDEFRDALTKAGCSLGKQGFLDGLSATDQERLRAEMAKAGKHATSPIIATNDKEPAKIKITSAIPKAGDIGWSMSVLPSINDDGTITLECDVKSDETTQAKEPTSSSVHTKRRLVSGRPTILSGRQADGKVRVYFITATVLEAAPEPEKKQPPT